MKKRLVYPLIASAMLAAPIFWMANAEEAEAKAAAKSTAVLETEIQKVSYSIGASIGGELKASELEIDVKSLSHAIQDIMEGNDLAMSEDEMMETMQNLQKTMQDKMAARQQEMQAEMEVKAEENKAAADAFLAENGKKEGVVTTESGLQYMVIEEGDGATPKENDKVTTHYKGTLMSGEVFDSSYDRGQPATFGVGQVIPGWTEALQKMKVGAKWKLFIPPDLAYGNQGHPSIPPNSLLIFEIELIDIAK